MASLIAVAGKHLVTMFQPLAPMIISASDMKKLIEFSVAEQKAVAKNSSSFSQFLTAVLTGESAVANKVWADHAFRHTLLYNLIFCLQIMFLLFICDVVIFRLLLGRTTTLAMGRRGGDVVKNSIPKRDENNKNNDNTRKNEIQRNDSNNKQEIDEETEEEKAEKRRIREMIKGRWFFVHAFGNAIVLYYCIPHIILLFKDPVKELVTATYFWEATQVATCIHVWHSIAYNLTAADILHHFVFAFASILAGFLVTFPRSCALYLAAITGLPGGIDYLNLFFVSEGKMSKDTRLRWAVRLNLWVRSPAVIMAWSMGWVWLIDLDVWQSGDYLKMGQTVFAWILITLGAVGNAQYYTGEVCYAAGARFGAKPDAAPSSPIASPLASPLASPQSAAAGFPPLAPAAGGAGGEQVERQTDK